MCIAFNALIIGDRARVIRYAEMPVSYRTKLMSLGLTPGTEFILKRCAPLGDPVEIHLRGFNLSLRRKEAAGLVVEKL